MGHKLPDGWDWVNLDSLCQKISLNKIKIKQKDYLTKGAYPVVDQGQALIGGYYNDINLLIPEEPPYVIFGDHTKVKKFISFRFIPGADGVKVLKPKTDVNPRFLYYSLFTIKIEDKGYARHFQLLEKKLFPFPPKETQQAIVSKIEELFSEIDKGIETLRTAQQQLKVYRQAVLKWAFEGRLTEEWRKQNASLIRIQTGSEGEENVLPLGWRFVPLKDACKLIGGVTKGRDFKGKQTIHLPYLRVANVQDGYLDLREIKEIEVLPTDKEKYKLLYGDILYNEGGDKDKLGRGTIWKDEIEDCIHQNHVFRARPIGTEFNSHYIAYFSQTRAAKDYFFRNGKQTTNLASINLTILSNLPLPVCSVNEQNQVVLQLESRLSVADKIEETITQSLQQAEALKQSILKQAFEGKLTPPAIAVAKKNIPLPPPVIEDPYARKVFAAYIISKCYNGRHFGKVVFQKTLHLAEYHCQCDYETAYQQKAAGPLDEFINRFIEEAAEKGWFTTHLKNKQIRFEPGPNLPELLLEYPQMFAVENAGMQQVLQLINNEALDAAELYSTVYAVWNNSLIRGVKPTKESIVSDVYDWSDRKEKFNEMQIWDAKNVLEKRGLVPMGLGKGILKDDKL